MSTGTQDNWSGNSQTVPDIKGAYSQEHINGEKLLSPKPRNYKWWLCMVTYTIFVISGQSAVTLLGRLYYDEARRSIWVATLVQLAGFPMVIPYYCLSPRNRSTDMQAADQPSALVLSSIYLSFGMLLAADNAMYSIGLLYLPVSTFSLICGTQLAFNALFSFFLHSQKFTPFIINSLVLLTISSSLLLFQADSANHTKVSNAKNTIGLLCTITASAGYGLMLSLTQLFFKKNIKRNTEKVALEMMIFQSLFASSAALLGLFISGEWKGLPREMEKFGMGEISYVMTLIETAVASQIFVAGTIGLIFEVSSLFSNAISVLGLPVIPILAVIFFHEKMDAIKVIALLLAIWGFVSYVYQCYLDSKLSKNESSIHSDISSSPLLDDAS